MGENEKNRSNSTNDVEEFDWSAFESKEVLGLDKEAIFASFESLFSKIKVGDIVEGTVNEINWRGVYVNIYDKGEGFVPRGELRYNPNLKVGDKIDVLIEDDTLPLLLISHKKARVIKWQKQAIELFANDNTTEGVVIARTRGGLVIKLFGGLDAFLPASQFILKPNESYNDLIGRTIIVKIVCVDKASKEVIVSNSVVGNSYEDTATLYREIADYLQMKEDLKKSEDELDREWEREYDRKMEEHEEKIYNAEMNPPSKASMIFTCGNISRCPHCGNHSIKTYLDGTALCEKCYKWFRYT